jgi:hypothetical protein
MLLRTPATTIVGTGGVNFANEAIALDLKPYNNNFTPLSLHTPLQVRGTLGQPTYHLQKENLIERLGAAVGLGILFPPAALLPLIDTGLGPGNACQSAYGAAPQPAADGGPRR